MLTKIVNIPGVTTERSKEKKMRKKLIKTKAMKDTYENYLDYLISGYDLNDYLVDLYYTKN